MVVGIQRHCTLYAVYTTRSLPRFDFYTPLGDLTYVPTTTLPAPVRFPAPPSLRDSPCDRIHTLYTPHAHTTFTLHTRYRFAVTHAAHTHTTHACCVLHHVYLRIPATVTLPLLHLLPTHSGDYYTCPPTTLPVPTTRYIRYTFPTHLRFTTLRSVICWSLRCYTSVVDWVLPG